MTAGCAPENFVDPAHPMITRPAIHPGNGIIGKHECVPAIRTNVSSRLHDAIGKRMCLRLPRPEARNARSQLQAGLDRRQSVPYLFHIARAGVFHRPGAASSPCALFESRPLISLPRPWPDLRPNSSASPVAPATPNGGAGAKAAARGTRSARNRTQQPSRAPRSPAAADASSSSYPSPGRRNHHPA